MSATITITRGTSLPNSASKTDFHNLIDTATGVLSGTITTSDISASAGIVGTQLSASANIADTQLAQITTASKVHGSSITGLASTPSGAGIIPIANLASGTPDGTKFVRDDGTLQSIAVQSAATQAEQETSTSVITAVTPGRQQYHPSAAKAWCMFNGNTGGTNAPTVGYNVTSVTRNSAGNYTVNLTVPFSSANFCVTTTGVRTVGSGATVSATPVTLSTGTIVVITTNSVDATVDCDRIHVTAFGDQ